MARKALGTIQTLKISGIPVMVADKFKGYAQARGGQTPFMKELLDLWESQIQSN